MFGTMSKISFQSILEHKPFGISIRGKCVPRTVGSLLSQNSGKCTTDHCFELKYPIYSVFSAVNYWLTQCQRIRFRSIKNVKDDAKISLKFCVRPFERRKLNFELMDFYASPDSEAVT